MYIEWNTITDVGNLMDDTGGLYLDGCNWNFQLKLGTDVLNNTINGVQPTGPAGVPRGPSKRKGIYGDSGSVGLRIIGNHISNVQSGGDDIFLHAAATGWRSDGKTDGDPEFQWYLIWV
jgi:hypothetical protein